MSVDSLLQSLPKNTYSNPKLLTKSLSTLSSTYRTLTPSLKSYFAPSGTSQTLITLTGTLPISYRGNAYNIPLEIYLPETYPHRPPLVFVRPTATMMIKPSHRHVDREGMVYMPYLHSWKVGNSDLSEMCKSLTTIFGAEPPVYAKPLNEPAQQQHHHQQQQQYQDNGYGGNGGYQPQQGYQQQQQVQRPQTYAYNAPTAIATAVAISSSTHQQRPSPPSYDSIQTQSRASPPPQNTGSEKEQALAALTVKLQESIKSLYNESQKSITKNLGIQSKLKESSVNIVKDFDALRRRKADLIEADSVLTSRIKILEETIAKKIEEATNADAVQVKLDPSTLIIPKDPVSLQLLNLNASISAADDLFYHLDRAIHSGAISLEDGLKEVRKVARKQFLDKAGVAKIWEVSGGNRGAYVFK